MQELLGDSARGEDWAAVRLRVSGGRIVDAGTVRALSAHGFGPTQIARRLGVSRMTVWRKLAAAEA